jgi:hypothetical protein
MNFFDNVTWLMSAITLYCMFLTGNKDRRTWALTFLNQCLWFAWITHSRNWGLLPTTIGITVLAIRNWVLWSRDAQAGGNS